MLALIAGQGRLPGLLSAQLEQGGETFEIFEMAGFPVESISERPVRKFHIEQLGTLLDTLVAQGFTQVCFAGSIRRPIIDSELIDTATKPLVPRIMQAIASGDDGALRVIIGLFSERGLQVRAADEIAPHLVPGSGVLTRTQPTDQHRVDALIGWEVLKEQGAADLGQACVIHNGQVVTRETLAGTDVMLASLGQVSGGILFKGPKPGQDRRADLPTIGMATVKGVVTAGLDGIVVEAGGVMVLDLAEVVEMCDRAAIFLLVRERP